MPIRILTNIVLTALLAVMANFGKAHAGASLPREIPGLWCYFSESGDARTYLPTDNSSPRASPPCSEGAEWMAIDADGSYRGQEYRCKAVKLTVINRGVVIGRTPGANAAYGLDARCEGNGAAWRERTRIWVERWGSSVTIQRTSINPTSGRNHSPASRNASLAQPASSVVSEHSAVLASATFVIWDPSGGCFADQCPLLRIKCETEKRPSGQSQVLFSFEIPFLNEEAEAKLFQILSKDLLRNQKRAGGNLTLLSLSMESSATNMGVDDIAISFSMKDGYSVSMTTEFFPRILASMLATPGTIRISLSHAPIRKFQTSPELGAIFKQFQDKCELYGGK
jgi:hypothetical protein